MSKGTVINKPSATHGTVKLEINDETDPNFSKVPVGTLLSFGPVNPEAYAYVHDGDYMEFTITSTDGGKNGTGSCNLIKKTQSRGIVRDVSVDADAQGTLMVTVGTPSSGLTKNADVTFNNNSGVVLKQNDYVEFDYMEVTYQQTGKKVFDATRKIESRGDITVIPSQGAAGTINVTQAADNSGVTVPTGLSFLLPTPVPSPFNLRDIVEVNIKDDKSCDYVQLLEPGPTN